MAVALVVLFVAVPVLLGGLWQEADHRASVEADARRQEAEARRKIESLERERTRQLFHAFVNEAAARRSSPRVGHRFEALDRIVAARDLADELNLPNENYVRLRSEAISALSLTDLRSTETGPGWAFRFGSVLPLFRHAGGKDCYLEWDKPSGLFVRRVGDSSIVQRIPDLTPPAEIHDSPQISPDNRYVCMMPDSKLVVWQVDGDKPREVVRRAEVAAVAFAPDRPEAILVTRQGELVIQPLEGKGEPKVLRIPEIQKDAHLLHGHDAAVARRQAAVVGNNSVNIVDLDTGKVTAVCSLPEAVYHMVWSPDGATLAIVDTGTLNIVLYQPASKSRRVVKGPVGGAALVAFDPTGRFLLSFSLWSGRCILWDVANASAELRFSNSELGSKGAAHSGSQVVGWWQGAQDPPHHVITSLLPEDGNPHLLGASAVHPSGRLLVNQTSDGIVLSDLATGQRLGSLANGKGTTVCFDVNGNLFGSINYQPHRWPITTEGNHFKIGQPERLDLPPTDARMDISADGRFVVAAVYDGSVLLDRQTGKTTRLQPQEDVRIVAIHPNGSLVASFGWNTKGFRLWEAKTGKLIHAIDKGYTGRGRFTPDGKYLIATGGSDIQLWSVPDCKLVRTLGSYGQFSISPDSRTIAAAEEGGKVRLNRIDNGDLIARFDAPGDDYLSDIHFSPDGRYLCGVNVEGTKYHVWDLWKLRQQLRELKLDWEKDPPPKPDPVRESIVVEIAKQ
jgi:WD40 repeat protein